jgi:serine phosphatase RsbU (regulator of sigma subunit)
MQRLHLNLKIACPIGYQKVKIPSFGVTEAMNTERQLFSTERIKQALHAHREVTPPSAIPQQLLEHVKSFVNNAPQSDDIAILAIRYYGPIDEKA